MYCVYFKIPYDYIVSIKTISVEKVQLKMKENTDRSVSALW